MDNLDYNCPIRQEIMLKPVKAECGHIFDNKSIEMWLLGESKTCPLDRMPIHTLIPQQELETEIHTYIHLNPLLFENKSVEELLNQQNADSEETLRAAQNSDFQQILHRNRENPNMESRRIDFSFILENIADIRMSKGTTQIEGVRGPVEYVELAGNPVNQFAQNLLKIHCPDTRFVLQILGEISNPKSFQIVTVPPEPAPMPPQSNLDLMIIVAVAMTALAISIFYLTQTEF
jgi:hypothetical protein